MLLTPAQMGMYALLGEALPMGTPCGATLTELIQYGHDFLVQVAGIDLGYDPQKWHEHLRATNAGGYRWSKGHVGFPRRIAKAVADLNWRDAVQQLTRPADGATPTHA